MDRGRQKDRPPLPAGLLFLSQACLWKEGGQLLGAEGPRMKWLLHIHIIGILVWADGIWA